MHEKRHVKCSLWANRPVCFHFSGRPYRMLGQLTELTQQVQIEGGRPLDPPPLCV